MVVIADTFVMFNTYDCNLRNSDWNKTYDKYRKVFQLIDGLLVSRLKVYHAPLKQSTVVCPVPFSNTSLLKSHLMPNHIPCFAVKEEWKICIPRHSHHAALTLKTCLHCSTFSSMKAKFLSFHWERGEAEEYCLRMFHIPTSLTAHFLLSAFGSFS